MVRLAFIVPVFFSLILGIIEFGRTSVDNRLDCACIDGIEITVDPVECGLSGFGEPATVAAGIPFGQVKRPPSPMLVGGGTELMATTVMRRQTVW